MGALVELPIRRLPVDNTPRLAAALMYAPMGLRVVLLHEAVDGACSCKDAATCKGVGKHPRTEHGVKDATTDEVTIRRWLNKYPTANIGIAAGQGIVVIDVDDGGFATLQRFEDEAGERIPETLTQRTPSGGAHLVFSDPDSAVYANSVKFAPGLDVRTDGGLIVVAPSVGVAGQWRWDRIAPIAPLPKFLKDRLRRKDAPTPRPVLLPRPVGANDADLERRARHYVEKMPIAVSGSGGHNSTFAVARALWGFVVKGLSESSALAIFVDYNSKCDPPWSERELQHKFDSAKSADHVPALEDRHAASRAPPAGGDSLGSCDEGGLDVARLHFSDMGAATVFAHLHKDGLRYVADVGYWRAWDGCRWREATGSDLRRAARDVSRYLLRLAAGIEDDARRAAVGAWSIKLEAVAKQDSMIVAATADQALEVRAADLDQHRHLLTVTNGTIDLRTGELRAHRRADLITKMVTIPYLADAAALRWGRFLAEVFDGKADLIEFIRRVVGYSLTGETNEHALFIFYGQGCNGKSRFLAALRSILGELVATAAITALAGRRDRAGAPSGDLAALCGARVVTISESDDGVRFSEALVKDLTGDDPITARKLYHDEITFAPTFKIYLATNHRPTIRGTDDGIWRRLRLVPFDVSFLGREDKRLDEQLRAEASGILAWAVAGAVEWYRTGLGKSPTVAAATESYRQEQDGIAAFIDECLVLDADGWISSDAIYQLHKAWVERQGERPVSQKILAGRLAGRRGIEPRRRKDGRGFAGLRARAATDE